MYMPIEECFSPFMPSTSREKQEIDKLKNKKSKKKMYLPSVKTIIKADFQKCSIIYIVFYKSSQYFLNIQSKRSNFTVSKPYELYP